MMIREFAAITVGRAEKVLMQSNFPSVENVVKEGSNAAENNELISEMSGFMDDMGRSIIFIIVLVLMIVIIRKTNKK